MGCFFLLLQSLIPAEAFEVDKNCWIRWTEFIFEHGLGNTYKFTTDYPPFYQYVLWGYSLFQDNVEKIGANIYQLKRFTLIFDFVGVVFVYRILKERIKNETKALLCTLFLLLNITYLYNTVFWGQVDAIMMAFIFVAFYYAMKERVLFSLLFIVMAMNTKFQSVIFIPFLFLILLPIILRQFSIRNVVAWLLLPILLQFLILLPFILAGDLQRMWHQVFVSSVGRYPYVSLNAYNMWCWVIEERWDIASDKTLFLGITYNRWGFGLFFLAYCVSLYPLIKNTYERIFKISSSPLPIEKILLIGALIPLVFFFFNTQMHERYCHVTIIFIAAYSFLRNHYFPYIIFSIGYFLNLEDVARTFEWGNYNTFILSGKVISIYFLLAISTMLISLYRWKPS